MKTNSRKQSASFLKGILSRKVDGKMLLNHNTTSIRLWSEWQPGQFRSPDTQECFNSTIHTQGAHVFVHRFWPDGTPVPLIATNESQIVA